MQYSFIETEILTKITVLIFVKVSVSKLQFEPLKNDPVVVKANDYVYSCQISAMPMCSIVLVQRSSIKTTMFQNSKCL